VYSLAQLLQYGALMTKIRDIYESRTEKHRNLGFSSGKRWALYGAEKLLLTLAPLLVSVMRRCIAVVANALSIVFVTCLEK